MGSVPIIVADLSKYDPDDVADDYAGVILNVEDPNLRHKAQIAHDAGVPILVYSWVYPNDAGHSATRAEAAVELLAADGIHATGFAFHDYEQNGVTVADLEAGLNLADQKGLATGTYTYLSLLNEQPGLADLVRRTQATHPLWIAYYPSSDGHYAASMSDTAHLWGAVLHQFTSTNGTRDLSVVLDEGWWTSVAGGDTMTPDQVKSVIFDKTPFGVSNFEVAFKAAAEKYVLPAVAQWEQDTRKLVLDGITPIIASALKGTPGVDDADQVAAKVVAKLAAQLSK